MKKVMFVLSAALLSGCVSFGLECKREDVNAWVRVKRFGYGVSQKQAEALATFKEKVCR